MVLKWTTTPGAGLTTGAINVLKMSILAAGRRSGAYSCSVRTRFGGLSFDQGKVRYRTSWPYPACSGRDLGLTTRWNSSSGRSSLTISGIVRVQPQWAPEGWAGLSVSRLMATRIGCPRTGRARDRTGWAPTGGPRRSRSLQGSEPVAEHRLDHGQGEPALV